MTMLSKLIIIVLSSASLYLFPVDGLTICEVTIPRYVYRALVQGTLLYIGYKVIFASSSVAAKPKYVYFSETQKMRAQVIRQYGASSKLELETDYPAPKVVNPKDVLVRVKAASVNPIDYRLAMGHARPLIDKMRSQKGLPFGGDELPLVLGRDCSGVVEAVGPSVTKFNVGDEVYLSVSAADCPGTFAELVLAKEDMVARKPSRIDHAQATSIPHVCVTTWNALVNQCGLGPGKTEGKRVLILAGTGGVGSFAIQLVKAWGGHVTTTCSTEGTALVERLGADDVIDYQKEPNLAEALAKRPRFDVAYLTLGNDVIAPCLSALKRGGRASTIVVPFLAVLKKHGKLLGGIICAAMKLRWKLQDLWHGRKFMFAFSFPNGKALEQVAELVDQKKIVPVIQRTFDFDVAHEAVEFVKKGHARGKTIIVM